jgi:hypothetical protein
MISVSTRSCPRCRPVERGLRAKWCSETCRVLDAQRRRWTEGGSETLPRSAASPRLPVLRVQIESWHEALGRAVVRGAACEDAVRKAREALHELVQVLKHYGQA